MTYKFNPFTGQIDDVGLPLPSGGTQYQVLQKNSATNGDAVWTDRLYSSVFGGISVDFTDCYLWDDIGTPKFDWIGGLFIGNLDLVGGQLTCQTINSQETKANVSTTTTALTLGAYFSILLCKSGPYTISLPNAQSGYGQRIFWIKNIDPGVITVTAFGTQKIDGVSSKTLNQWETLNICCDGYNWFVI